MSKVTSKHILLSVLIGCLSLAVLISLCAPVGDGSHKVDFRIPSQVGATYVSKGLKNSALIANATFFRWFLRFSGLSAKIQVGTYELNDGMWLNEIASKISSGRVKLSALTIPEGWNNRQIGSYLVEKGLLNDRSAFLVISRDSKLLKKYAISNASTEGYLYPDTYMIPEFYSAEKIHLLMLDAFFRVLDQIIDTKKYSAQELQRRIILASIVEREARHAKERPIIARVFLNRLERRMKLESCATVQYLFEKSKPKLYLQDLAIPSKYNTYIHYGLPPGPIANSGKAALKAAFYSDENDYLYFVVKPDGTHHFSSTYGEHIRGKRKYIDSDLVPDHQ